MLRLVVWPSIMLLGWTETELWTLKYGSESIQTSRLILRQRPPKPHKLLKLFISFSTTVKFRHAPTTWKQLRWKSLCLPILKSITEIIKILRVYMILGDAVSQLQTFVWILNHISRSITWSLYTLKASYLVKWPISTGFFMWWCQFIDLLKLKLAPVPCSISEWPIRFSKSTSYAFLASVWSRASKVETTITTGWIRRLQLKYDWSSMFRFLSSG